MAVAKYPASHGNASHIETFNGVFCFNTSKSNWPCNFFFKSETCDESVFAWFLGGQVLKCLKISFSATAKRLPKIVFLHRYPHSKSIYSITVNLFYLFWCTFQNRYGRFTSPYVCCCEKLFSARFTAFQPIKCRKIMIISTHDHIQQVLSFWQLVRSVYRYFQTTFDMWPVHVINSNSNLNSLLQVTCNKSLCIYIQEIQMNKGHKSVQENIIPVDNVICIYQYNIQYIWLHSLNKSSKWYIVYICRVFEKYFIAD